MTVPVLIFLCSYIANLLIMIDLIEYFYLGRQYKTILERLKRVHGISKVCNYTILYNYIDVAIVLYIRSSYVLAKKTGPKVQ